MKRIFSLLTALALAFCLCACGEEAEPAPAEPTAVSEPAEAPERTAEPAARPAPTLSPGAESQSLVDGVVQTGADGTVFALVRAEGLVCVYDLLPEGVGYIYGFLAAEDMLYIVVKDEYFSLDPATLYALSPETEALTVLAEDCSAGCAFCLMGDSLYYESYDSGIKRVELATGEIFAALPEAERILAVYGGVIFYTKADGGLYRNDSTLGAETRLLESCGSYWLFPAEDSLCDVVYRENGTIAVLEFRDGGGNLRSQRVLEETAGGLYAHGGKVYVPQPEAQWIQIYDIATGEEEGSVPLTGNSGYYFIRAVTDEAIYYESSVDGTFYLYRMAPDGGEPELLGQTDTF